MFDISITAYIKLRVLFSVIYDINGRDFGDMFAAFGDKAEMKRGFLRCDGDPGTGCSADCGEADGRRGRELRRRYAAIFQRCAIVAALVIRDDVVLEYLYPEFSELLPAMILIEI
jgi:hypothetical protein